MDYFDAFLYGLVQGLTEYLPVSSSAHLILLPKFLNIDDPGLTFDVFLHLGTLFATFTFFWKDWKKIFQSFVKKVDKAEVTWKEIALGTLPALLMGALLYPLIKTVFRSHEVLVWTLSIGGIALFVVDALASRQKKLSDLGIKGAFIVGLIQCLALIPGVSRSGSTITAGRLLGLDRASAARFSFLLSAPITFAAVVFELRHWDQIFQSSLGTGPVLVAFLSSFLFGLVAIGGLLKVVQHFSFLSFAVYRVLVAFVIYFYLL